MKQIKVEGKTLETFDFSPDVQKQIFTPIDNISDNFLDEADKSATEIFYYFINNDKCSFKLFNFLEGLSKVNVGFTFNIS